MERLHRRDRLLSFRLSEKEYETLRQMSLAQGARSLSDFARTALRNAVIKPGSADSLSSTTLHGAMSELSRGMVELSRAIEHMVQQSRSGK
jgi:hypothetical protein